MTEKSKLLKIGELAKQTDELVSTIRYWTSEGLLEVSEYSKGGYQLYDPSMIDRAKQIRKLQNNDRLTIAEIKTDMFGEGGKEEVEEYYTNDMNETKMKQTKENPKVVANVLWRYEIWSDGIVYDTEKAEDIPEYIFEIRDLIMKEKE